MAFVLVTIREIRDQAAFDEYASKVKPLIESYGGRYIAIEREHETTAGEWPFVRTVLVEFPTLGRLKEWYRSAEYQALIPIRERGIDINFVILRSLEETKQERKVAQ
jgi:uncharacterized protein (DUF1330 family)